MPTYQIEISYDGGTYHELATLDLKDETHVESAIALLRATARDPADDGADRFLARARIVFWDGPSPQGWFRVIGDVRRSDTPPLHQSEPYYGG